MKTQKNKVAAPPMKQLLRDPVQLLGFGFGSGLLSPAPGTWGTLIGLLVFLPILLWSESLAWLLLGLGLIAGSWICQRSAEAIGVHDHGSIVWDEFIGIWIVLILLPQQTWPWWLGAFVTFRLFDIVKPWPIRWLDQHLKGGFGIMADDVLAAFFAVALLWLVFSFAC
ncbi:MAG: phosphatidylglycerophosphatase A [Thiotrichales bacterium]|nr:phosphatidylglycerophosphatase A [Thiotrichales bacterium]